MIKKKNNPWGCNSFTGWERGRQDRSCQAYILGSQQSWISCGQGWTRDSRILVNQTGVLSDAEVLLRPPPQFVLQLDQSGVQLRFGSGCALQVYLHSDACGCCLGFFFPEKVWNFWYKDKKQRWKSSAWHSWRTPGGLETQSSLSTKGGKNKSWLTAFKTLVSISKNQNALLLIWKLIDSRHILTENLSTKQPIIGPQQHSIQCEHNQIKYVFRIILYMLHLSVGSRYNKP